MQLDLALFQTASDPQLSIAPAARNLRRPVIGFYGLIEAWIDLEDVRVTALKAESEITELVERLMLGFAKVKVSYTPQDALGAVGGGTNVFETSALETARE